MSCAVRAFTQTSSVWIVCVFFFSFSSLHRHKGTARVRIHNRSRINNRNIIPYLESICACVMDPYSVFLSFFFFLMLFPSPLVIYRPDGHRICTATNSICVVYGTRIEI